MKYLNCILGLAIGFAACTSRQGDNAKMPIDTAITTISVVDSAANNLVDGIYVGQKINEFISLVQQKYDVKKEIMQLEGDDYDIYNVYKNGEKIYSVEPDFDNPSIVWRFWIYSPKFKTEKGIGVGSTFAEIKSKYHIEYIQTEGVGLGVKVKETPASFYMDCSKLSREWWNNWWEKIDNDVNDIPENLPIQEIIIWDKNVYITLDNKVITK